MNRKKAIKRVTVLIAFYIGSDNLKDDLLNEMIKYIEENLCEDIKYQDLARIVGISEYTLQRIFVFLTGISISEYIRKRRLSKAFEELKRTNNKIIDIAVKYHYDSAISFSRAFKQYFDMTPTECRNSNKSYKLLPIIEFHKENNICDELKYEIREIEEKTLYCFGVKAKEHEDLLYKIRELYKSLKSQNVYNKIKSMGMYGISICKKDGYEYYVGSELKLQNTQDIKVEKGKYAIFEVGSDEQKDIVKTYDFVYSKWLKSTNYELLNKPEIECYENDNCYLYFQIKDKQN